MIFLNYFFLNGEKMIFTILALIYRFSLTLAN